MKIQIFDESNNLVWERSNNGGVTNSSHIINGVGLKIIDALRAGLDQIEGELGMFDNTK